MEYRSIVGVYSRWRDTELQTNLVRRAHLNPHLTEPPYLSKGCGFTHLADYRTPIEHPWLRELAVCGRAIFLPLNAPLAAALLLFLTIVRSSESPASRPAPHTFVSMRMDDRQDHGHNGIWYRNSECDPARAAQTWLVGPLVLSEPRRLKIRQKHDSA